MSFANVLPSAPELYPMAEMSQINAEDFRLKKISDLLKNYLMKPSTTGKWQRNANGATPLCTLRRLAFCGAFLCTLRRVAFCGAILRSPGNGLNRVRHCCKPRACWCCYGLRAGLSWLCCHKEAARTERG